MSHAPRPPELPWWLGLLFILALAVMTRAHAREPLDCLTDNIYYEAGHEPYEGKVAVGQVTLNRARDLGGDICKAVYAKAINPSTGKKEAAFSWTLGARWRPRRIDLAAYDICALIAFGMIEGTVRSSVIDETVKFYHAIYVHPRWRHMVRVARIGQHVFYREE